MFDIGNRVKITADHFKRNIGREGEIVAIHEASPKQYPIEVKLDPVGIEPSVNRCYHRVEMEVLNVG